MPNSLGELNSKEPCTVPYIVHEGDMARMERSNRRLVTIIYILIILFIGSNAGWLYYESQFEDTTTTIEQEVEQESSGDGNNSFIGGDCYGVSEN